MAHPTPPRSPASTTRGMELARAVTRLRALASQLDGTGGPANPNDEMAYRMGIAPPSAREDRDAIARQLREVANALASLP